MASAVLKDLTYEVFSKNISKSRIATGKSIQNFKFKKNRCRLLSEYEEIREDCKGVIYWMLRESRVQDNWALLYAQKLSLKYKVPLHVCFFLNEFKELYPTTRQVEFLRKGLDIVQKELQLLNITFYLLKKTPLELVNIIKENNIGCLVCDFFPLKIVTSWQEKLKESLPDDVAFVQVDAHNIVPCWVASDKLERAARSIRPKILKQLPVYLTEFPEVCKQEKKEELNINRSLLWGKDDKLDIKFVDEILWAKPGEEAGLEMLRTFLVERLKYYGISSNDPSKKHQSNLSPWLHFGQISAQRIALEVSKLKHIWKEQCERFLEEAIIRKEISDNFCLYNPNYDNFNGADKWAVDTLNLHRGDKRAYIYTAEQFEKGLTHDPIWNSAQIQLVTEGKLQGYMRMYWCKKILEWTESPEKAIEIALWLNDTYSIDGSDPNGFVGVMWSICGIHDQGFKERPVFGKIRFMVDYCLSRKFDIKTYCAKYCPTAKASSKITKYMDSSSDSKIEKKQSSEESKVNKSNKKIAKKNDDHGEPSKKKKKI
ncbi:hypothetical protein WA026_004458 [Henosepilachna vigintioctopunctata]|uniref:Deoxyribodipyrimidine photo-lyase n=1 Tax=Henosepilachna vigintioctopunctata TaxID=420089 RepID=A0AAW1V3E6_9CUCU